MSWRRNTAKICITHRNNFSDQRFKFFSGLCRLQIGPLHLPDFLLREDPDNVPFLDHPKVFNVQDNIQGLIPRHVNESDTQTSLDLFGGDDIHVAHIGNQLKDIANISVIENQTDLLACIITIVDLDIPFGKISPLPLTFKGTVCLYRPGPYGGFLGHSG